jgi:hypothetical protein
MTLMIVAWWTRSVVAVLLVALVALLGQRSLAQQKPRSASSMPSRDLSGIWQALNTAAWDIEDHSARPGVPPGQGVVLGGIIPYQPWALEQKRKNFANRLTLDPVEKCSTPGVPRAAYLPYPFQIFQTDKQITIFSEYSQTTRIIFLHGKHPDGAIDWWMGDSRGHWEGNTLVVDVKNLIENWFDQAGNFYSGAAHMVERYTRTGPDHIRYEVTVEDPKVFTKPWQMRMPLYRRVEPNVQLLEYECVEFVQEAAAAAYEAAAKKATPKKDN